MDLLFLVNLIALYNCIPITAHHSENERKVLDQNTAVLGSIKLYL